MYNCQFDKLEHKIFPCTPNKNDIFSQFRVHVHFGSTNQIILNLYFMILQLITAHICMCKQAKLFKCICIGYSNIVVFALLLGSPTYYYSFPTIPLLLPYPPLLLPLPHTLPYRTLPYPKDMFSRCVQILNHSRIRAYFFFCRDMDKQL